MPLRLPKPGSFEKHLQEAYVQVGNLVRLSKYPDTEPWWSRGRYRFDGPVTGASGGFGTCYAAETIEVAFSESVVHECALWVDGKYEVAAADLNARHMVWLRRPARPTLVLADFTGAALKKLGLNNDISAGDDYVAPQAWAKAIHDSDPKWDGLLHVSRQHNDRKAVALFERSGVLKAKVRKLDGAQLKRLCTEFGVVAV